MPVVRENGVTAAPGNCALDRYQEAQLGRKRSYSAGYKREATPQKATPQRVFASRQQARIAAFACIEVFYNRQRLYSGSGCARPVSHAA